MQVEEKQIVNSFKVIARTLPMPVIVFSADKELVVINDLALILFGANGEVKDFFDLFAKNETSKIRKILDSAIDSSVQTNEVLVVKLASNKTLRLIFKFNQYLDEEGNKFLILLPENKVLEEEPYEGMRLAIPSASLVALLANDDLINIINSIKSSYPFTFLGKTKIQGEIDKLEELFWIKDTLGKYVIVNKQFSNALGFKSNQIEGKQEKNFLPLYLHDFYVSIENYIKETLNYFVLDGFFLKGNLNYPEFRTIEIPLVDAENCVIAIIGIAQRKSIANSFRTTKMDIPVEVPKDTVTFSAIPSNCIVIDSTGLIVGISDLFKSSFKYEDKKWIGVSFEKFLPPTAILAIKDLITKSDEKSSKPVKMLTSENVEENFKVKIKRFFKTNSETPNYFIVFESVLVNFETLINSKNPMNEILIQNSPEPLFIYDTENLTFIEVNEAALALYGYSRNEFLQMDLTDLYTPDEIQTLLDNSRYPEGKYGGPFKHRKKSGEIISVEISRFTIPYQNKEAHLNYIRDNSAKIQLERDNRFYQLAYELTDDLVFVTDSTGFIEYHNPAVEEKLGYAKRELLKNSIIELIDNDSRNLFLKDVFNRKATKTTPFKGRIKKINGEFIDVEFNARAVDNSDDDSKTYFIVAKRGPQKVEVIKEVVKEVIKEVIKEVPREVFIEKKVNVPVMGGVTKVSQGIDPSQMSFIFHEILTPINVIIGFVYELKDSLEEPTDDQTEAIEIISQNRTKLLETMDSIGEYAQVEKDAVEVTAMDMNFGELFKRVQREIEDGNNSALKPLNFGKISSSFPFKADGDKLKNFVFLLIKIASHVSNEQTLILSAYQFNEDNFILSIKDVSNKISDKLLDNLTDLFSEPDIPALRTMNVSRFTVFSIRKLYEILGGRMEITNKSGKPYEMGFVFPINPDYTKIVSTLGLSDLIKTGKSRDSKKYIPATVPPPQIKQPEPVKSYQPEISNATSFRKTFASNTEDPKPIPQSEPKQGAYQPPVEKYSKPVENQAQVPQESFQNRSNSRLPEGSPFRKTFIPDAPRTEPLEVPKANVYVEPKPIAPQPVPNIAPLPVQNVPPVRKAISLSELSCLYMEDQLDSQVLFKVQLKEMKKIRCVQSFEEAIPLLETEVFDFIVVDINLEGEYNGLDALKVLRQMPSSEKTPTIAVTAYVLPGDKEKFIKMGFSDFISKPIFRDRMMVSLEKILNK